MSVRYYWISFIVVLGLTIIISWVRQTRSRKEFFLIMVFVTVGLVLIGFILAGLAKLFEYLGISESGFIY